MPGHRCPAWQSSSAFAGLDLPADQRAVTGASAGHLAERDASCAEDKSVVKFGLEQVREGVEISTRIRRSGREAEVLVRPKAVVAARDIGTGVGYAIIGERAA